jgi:hypothetical protein
VVVDGAEDCEVPVAGCVEPKSEPACCDAELNKFREEGFAPLPEAFPELVPNKLGVLPLVELGPEPNIDPSGFCSAMMRAD